MVETEAGIGKSGTCFSPSYSCFFKNVLIPLFHTSFPQFNAAHLIATLGYRVIKSQKDDRNYTS